MKASNNYFTDDRDLNFHVKTYPWEQILKHMPFHEAGAASDLKRDLLEMLDPMGEFIASELAPYAAELEQETPTLKDGKVTEAPRLSKMMSQLAEMGAMSIGVSPEWGGLGFPLMAAHTVTQMLGRVDISLGNSFAYFVGSLKILEHFNGQIDFSSVFPKVMEGQEFGAMVLTEPQAGSDLSKVSTKATKHKDGTWRINGQKIWITLGHGEHQFVLARTEDPTKKPGLRGLSLFYAKATNDDGSRNIDIEGLEKRSDTTQ